MNITLMAHDKKKELMVQFCTAYKSILSKHLLSQFYYLRQLLLYHFFSLCKVTALLNKWLYVFSHRIPDHKLNRLVLVTVTVCKHMKSQYFFRNRLLHLSCLHLMIHLRKNKLLLAAIENRT